MQQKLKKIRTNFLFFLELQLLITVVILPILIAWGLPISIMSLIGNLIFGPFLTTFILVSTILFTCDFFGIPNTFVIITLEWITKIWHYCLSFGSPTWLIGYQMFMFPIACLVAIIACSIYLQKKHTQNQRIFYLIFLCACIPTTAYFFQNSCGSITVYQGHQKFHVLQKNNLIYAFDCGALGARPSSQSWLEYTLTPAMIKAMGATHIDVLVLCKSNSRTNDAVQILMDQIPVSRKINIA